MSWLPFVCGFALTYVGLSAEVGLGRHVETNAPSSPAPARLPPPPPAVPVTDAPPPQTQSPPPPTELSPSSTAAASPTNASTGLSPDVEDTGYFISPLLAFLHQPTDKLWETLLDALHRHRGLVVEVGSHDGAQAMQAYRRGYTVLALEPSPASHERVFRHIFREQDPPVDTNRIQLRRVAASEKEGTIGFWTVKGGGTGDHVTLDGTVHEGETHNYKKGNSQLREVPTAPLDSLLGDRRVYILKVDVQGHELFVFRGARRLFSERRVSFALFEFQPKQMGAEAHTLIEELDGYGYDVYFTDRHSQAHPWHDEHLLAPTDPVRFAASFDPNFIRGFGEWTDLVAVCRGCVGDNVWPVDPTALIAATPVPAVATAGEAQ